MVCCLTLKEIYHQFAFDLSLLLEYKVERKGPPTLI